MNRRHPRPVVRSTFALLALTGLLALAGCALPQGELLVTAAPTLSPAGGTFPSAQTVTLADATPSATIFYTTDGSTPTPASPVYTAPLTIAKNAVLSATAQAPQHEASPVVSAIFTINISSPITPQTAAPVISPASGTFASAQTISLADATPFATIYYTLDGTTPTTASTPYTAPFLLSTSATVHAIATAPGYTISPVATATYTISVPLSITAPPTISPASGTFASAQTISLADATPFATIYYTLDGTTPTTASTPYTAPFLLSTSATVHAMATAPGYTSSPVATATYTIAVPLPIATSPVISPAGGTFVTAQTVTLTDATPSARIYYTLDGSTPTVASTPYTAPFVLSTTATVHAMATATGYTPSPVATAAYTINTPLPVTATPIISPAGGAFTSVQTITLTDPTPGAAIYYTLDDTAPTPASPIYSIPLSITQTTTIRAGARASGHTFSPVATATFTLTRPAPTPVISPSSGTFTTSIAVSITDSASAATIYYTLDGTAPTSASPVYTSPLSIKKATTVRALAQGPGLTSSPIASATYTLIAIGLGVSGTATFNKKALPATSVSLYAAGQTGYGSAPTLVSSSPGLSDSFGSFSVPYTCPTASSLVYAVATGGQNIPGTGLSLVTLLGPCGRLSSSIVINEMTTVAAAWSVAPFIRLQYGTAQIGTTSTNVSGLSNAFLTAQTLVDINHGTIGGPSLPPGAVLPNAEMNTLADLLSSYATNATALFQAATPVGGVPPADTFSAAAEIARNPANGVSALYSIVTTASPFQPILTTPPTDWTLAVRYVGGGLDAPTTLAVDQAGSIWVANYFNSVSKFTPQGAALSPVTGYTGGGLNESFGLAIDASGNVWVTNEQSPGSVNSGDGSVTKLSSSGSVLSGTSGYSSGGMNYPEAVAIDTNGNVWVANYGNSTATLLSSTGTALSSSSGYGSGQMVFPVAVALDASHTAWFGNQGGSTITVIPQAGTPATQISCCQGASGIAIDQQGNLWTANYYGNSVSEIASDGKVISAGYNGGGLAGPRGIAVDGDQTIWVSNFQGDSITQLLGASSSNPGKASSLGASANLRQPYSLAIDASGSVWVTNFGDSSIVQFPGIASPVKTPLIALPQAP